MTLEQRKTLEDLALRYVNGPHAILTHAEYDALRAALAAPPKTCGTCLHDGCCGIQAVCVSSQHTDKRALGCIGAWTPKETPRG